MHGMDIVFSSCADHGGRVTLIYIKRDPAFQFLPGWIGFAEALKAKVKKVVFAFFRLRVSEFSLQSEHEQTLSDRGPDQRPNDADNTSGGQIDG